MCFWLAPSPYKPKKKQLERASSVPKRVPALPTAILFYATHAREVDEPKGLWLADADGDVRPLQDFKDVVGEEIEDIEAKPDGTACVLHLKAHVVLVEGQQKKPLAEEGHDFFERLTGWNTNGSRYVLSTGDKHVLFDNKGNNLGPLPSSGNKMIMLGWDTSGEALYTIEKLSEEKWSLKRMTPSGKVFWQTPISSNSRFFGILESDKCAVFPRFGENACLIQLGELGSYIVHEEDGTLQPAEPSNSLLSVSPSGRLAVHAGPQSLRRDEEVRLLKIINCEDPLIPYPLVRFTGTRIEHIRWCADESRFAFLVRGRDHDQKRLLMVRGGERYARSLSLPGQDPKCFDWVSPKFVPENSSIPGSPRSGVRDDGI
jgi:hypothetical protein